jgi:hypothetical protein
MSNFENFDEFNNHSLYQNLLEPSFIDLDYIRDFDDEDYLNIDYKEEKPIYQEKFSEESISKEKIPFKLDEEGMENEFVMDLNEDDEHSNAIDESFKGIIPDIKINEKIFDIIKVNQNNPKAPKYLRIDDYKILWRTKINKFYIRMLNDAIKQSDLPSEFKKIIHSPSYKKFTEVVKSYSAYKDLQRSMKDILCIGKETQKNQIQNYTNIRNIEIVYENNHTPTIGKIVGLLRMSYEEVIRMYYDTKMYKEIIHDDKARANDEELIRQKGITLFDEYGLITLFKSYFEEKDQDKKMIGKKRK